MTSRAVAPRTRHNALRDFGIDHGKPFLLENDWIVVYPPRVGSQYVHYCFSMAKLVKDHELMPDGPMHPTVAQVREHYDNPILGLTRDPWSWLYSAWSKRASRHRDHPQMTNVDEVDDILSVGEYPLPKLVARSFPGFVTAYLRNRPGRASAFLLDYVRGADFVLVHKKLDEGLDRFCARCDWSSITQHVWFGDNRANRLTLAHVTESQTKWFDQVEAAWRKTVGKSPR